jgi:hypothetical protein
LIDRAGPETQHIHSLENREGETGGGGNNTADQPETIRFFLKGEGAQSVRAQRSRDV